MDIDAFMVDRFWSNLESDIPIYVDKALIEWCGYQGEGFSQKLKLLKFLQSAGIEYFEVANEEYRSILNNLEVIQSKDLNWPTEIKTGKGYGRATHILITPRNFKKLVMRLSTNRGDQIREYFVSLEELFKVYCDYQVKYRETQVERCQEDIKSLHFKMDAQSGEIKKLLGETQSQSDEIKKLLGESYAQTEQLNRVETILETAVEQRVPPTQCPETHENFVLFRLPLDETNPNAFHFYVVRSQRASLGSACRRVTQRYTNATKVVEIVCQPNARNLFNRVKEKTRGRASFIYNSVRLNTMSPEEFIEVVHQANDERADV